MLKLIISKRKNKTIEIKGVFIILYKNNLYMGEYSLDIEDDSKVLTKTDHALKKKKQLKTKTQLGFTDGFVNKSRLCLTC